MQKGADDATAAIKKVETASKGAADAGKKRDDQLSASAKKRAQEEAKAAKEQEANAKKSAEAFSKLRNEVLGSIAAFVGFNALKNFGEHLNDANVQAGKLSQTLDIEPGFLKAFENSATKFNATAEDADSILRNLTKTGEDLKNAIMPSADAMVAFGRAEQIANDAGANVDTSKYYDVNATLKERLDIVNKIASHLSATDATNLLGRNGFGEGEVRMLQAKSDALKTEIALNEKLNKITKKDTDESVDRKTAWGHVKTGVDGVGNAILRDLNPAISGALDWMLRFTQTAQEHLPATEAAVEGLSLAVTALGLKSLAGTIVKVGEFTGGLGGAAAGASRLIGLLGQGGLVAAAGLAGYAIGSLLNDALDMMITKLTGAENSLGTFLYKLTHPNEKGVNEQTKEAFDAAKKGGQMTPSQIADMKAKNDAIMRSEQTGDFDQSAIKKPSINKPVTSGMSQAFEIVQAAKDAEKKYGIPAAITLAQYQLESGGGKHMPTGSNNPFGIKAKAGQPFVESETTEVDKNGNEYRTMQKFAKYESIADAFDAHAKLLANAPVYKNARSHEDDPAAFADALTGVYAKDPHYGSKLKSLIAPGSAIDKSLMMGAGASSAAAPINNNQSSNATHVETHIGNVNVNAPNAKTNGDVGNEIGKSMASYAFASNANLALA